MTQISLEKLEEYVNDVLKEDLNYLENHLKLYNEEIMEFMQLKNTIQTLSENLSDGYKTQMNIGANFFMQARVDQLDTILVNVGLGYFVEFKLEEALKFIEFKIKLLTKECDVVRSESIKKRSDIKLALMCMAEKEMLHLPERD